LSTDDLQYFETRFFLVPATGTVYVDAPYSVIRQRTVTSVGFSENLSIMNHRDAVAHFDVRIDAASDFADLFEVKDALQKQGHYSARTGGYSLFLNYERDTFSRGTQIHSSEPASVDDFGMSFAVDVAPHGKWCVDLQLLPACVTWRTLAK
jgi:hypothetical protein